MGGRGQDDLRGRGYMYTYSFQGGSVVKNTPADTGDAGDTGSIPESGRSSGVGNGNLLQYSCLERFHGQRSLAGYSPWGRKELDMTEQLSTHTHLLGSLCRIHCFFVLCLLTQSCPALCDPMDCSLPGSSVHGDSLGKNTGVGCHVFLQGIFPTQGSNPGLLHCRQIHCFIG